MRIGIFTVLYNEEPLEKVLKYVSDLGYEAVELAAWKGSNHLDIDKVLSGGAGELRRLVDKYNMIISGLFMDPNFPLVWRLRKDIAGSGALGDPRLTHVIDLTRFLVGEIDSLTSSPPWMVRGPVSAGRFGLHPSSLGGLALGWVSSPLPLSQVGLGVMNRPFIIATGSKSLKLKSKTHHQK